MTIKPKKKSDSINVAIVIKSERLFYDEYNCVKNITFLM